MSFFGSLLSVVIKPIVDCIWDSNARRANYVINFEDNHSDLMNKKAKLVALRDTLMTRVGDEQRTLHMRPTDEVTQWLEKVKAFVQEVDPISTDCSNEIGQRCCGGCCPKNWKARYRLGKIVHKKLLKSVTDLITQAGKFVGVTHRTLPPRAEFKIVPEMVGMDEKFEEIWGLIGDDTVNIIGVYGMGGVGKTTLLKKINNRFCPQGGNPADQANTFTAVIWVDVPRLYISESIDPRLESVQNQIGTRLDLTWLPGEDENQKARRISHVLSQEKFLILFDDVWKPLELEDIGIPFLNNSKVLFTTRLEIVCRDMQYNGRQCKTMLKMPLLSEDFSWDLFRQSVGDKALRYNSEIPELAKKVAEECGGLPLALIMIGKAMFTKETVEEWESAIETLKYYASLFTEMEQKVLAILKYSYDALDDPNVRNCFLYFSLYPEDCEINKGEIVQRWIGEGFLDTSNGMDYAVSNGRHIISSLQGACLLEGDRRECFVKMHGVVRDLALWIGQGENKMFLVEAGFKLSRMPAVESWMGASRISLMDNGIEELTGAPNCPDLLTLVLQLNNTLSTIRPDFFVHMITLRVLDLSQTSIVNIPKSIGKLCELRFLNLSDTNIDSLPDELENLKKLNHLNLDTNGPIPIPDWVISRFTRVLVLLSGSASPGDGNRTDSLRAQAEYLRCMKELRKSMKVQEPPPSNHKRFIKTQVILRCQGLSALRSSVLLEHIRVRQRVVLNIQYGENENHSGQSRKRYGFTFDIAETPSVVASETTSDIAETPSVSARVGITI